MKKFQKGLQGKLKRGNRMDKFDYEKDYEDFWKEIIEVNGVVSMDQVKRELFDFHCIMQEVPKVYDYITNGNISKPNTNANVVIGEFDRVQEEEWRDYLKDELECRGIIEKKNISIFDVNKGQVMALIEQKASPAYIAQAFGVSYVSFWKWMKNNGIKSYTRKYSRNEVQNTLDANKDKIFELLKTKGKSEVAREFGFTYFQLHTWLKKQVFKTKPKFFRKGIQSFLDECSEELWYYRSCYSLKFISEIFDCSETTIRRWFRRHKGDM
jgi:hypothetical protein